MRHLRVGLLLSLFATELLTVMFPDVSTPFSLLFNLLAFALVGCSLLTVALWIIKG